MRFAYIDSQGKEVGIPTVDALRLRIALRAIVEDTTFFDASTGRWAPAAEHEVFRSLRKELDEQEEGGFVAPPPPPHTVADEDGELEVEAAPEEVDEVDQDGDEFHFSISNAPGDAGESDDAPSGVADGTPEAAPAPPPGDDPQATSRQPVAADESDEEAGPAWPEDEDGDPVFDLNEEELVEPDKEQQESGPLRLTPELEAMPATGQPNAGVGEGDPGRPEAAAEVDTVGEAVAADEPGIGVEPELVADAEIAAEAEVAAEVDVVDETRASGQPGGDAGPDEEPHRLEGFSADRVEFEGMVESAGWGDEPPPHEPEVLSSADEVMGAGGSEADDDEGFGGALEVETDDAPPVPAEVPPSRSAPGPSAAGGEGDDELPIPTREEVRRRAEPAPGERPGAPARSAPPARVRRTRSSGGAVVAVVVALAAVGGGAWWFLVGRGGASEAADGPTPEPTVTIPDIAPGLEPRMRDIADGAHRETMSRLGELAAAADLPEEPDAEWLAGSYMANAGDYPGVQTYWEAMDRFLRRLQASQDSVFAVALAERVAASGLAADDARAVSERVEAGYRATSLDRAEAYRQARAVPETALRLHGFLVENEPSISYEPAAGGLSRDPVLEAVPDTPEIGEEMWDRVGEITASMDALGFLDRITTPRFLQAVLARVGSVEVR